MIRFLSGLSLLLLAACGEAPAPPKTVPAETKPAAPMMDAKPAPVVKAPDEEAPAPKKPAAPREKKEHVDKKGRAKSPELYKKFMAIMEENGDLGQAIEEDVEKGRGDAVIKPKVMKIAKNAEAARALHYRKNPDEDTELDSDFEIFLLKMGRLQEATWDAENGKTLYEDLGMRCTNCHVKFQ